MASRNKILTTILLFAWLLSASCVIHSSQAETSKAEKEKPANKDELNRLLRSPLTDETLASLKHVPIEEVKKWPRCLRAMREYELRVQQWGWKLSALMKAEKLRSADFERIDFSLPNTPGFGKNPENEFFNPNGRFNAVPVPQALIDELTTVKNTRLVFNLRRWYYNFEKLADKLSNFLILPNEAPVAGQYLTDLVVILPDPLPQCGTDTHDWWKNFYAKWDVQIAPDNRSIVEDKHGRSRWIISEDDNRRFMMVSIVGEAH